MPRSLLVVALAAVCGGGCADVADELQNAGHRAVALMTEPGGLINCPIAALSFLHPESWVLEGVWIGGRFIAKDVLIDSAVDDPESVSTEIRLELAAIANNQAMGVQYGPDVLSAAQDAQDWFARQTEGNREATANLVGEDIAYALRGSSFEAAVSCLDTLAGLL